MVDGRALLAWGMMFVQGCRRLYESIFIQKASSAKMWIGHYLVGCAFYFMMSLTVLAEDLPRQGGAFCTLSLLMTRYDIDAIPS